MLIVTCGLISVSCSNEELSIDNTATESELFNKKPKNPGNKEPKSLAVNVTFALGLGITGDDGLEPYFDSSDYVDGEQVNSNIRYGDGVGDGLFHYELSMWGNKRNPSRELVIDLDHPVNYNSDDNTPPKLGVSSSSTFLRVGNMHLLNTDLNDGEVDVLDGFVITRVNDLDGEDYRIKCGIDAPGTNMAVISYDYDSKTWDAKMTYPNNKCSVWKEVKRGEDGFMGLYHISFQLDLVASKTESE